MLYARIDNQAFTHGTTACILNILARVAFNADQIQRTAEHFVTGGTDNRICLGVDTAAKLIAFPARYIQFLAYTVV